MAASSANAVQEREVHTHWRLIKFVPAATLPYLTDLSLPCLSLLAPPTHLPVSLSPWLSYALAPSSTRPMIGARGLDLSKFNARPDWPLTLTSKRAIGKPKCRIATRKRVSLASPCATTTTSTYQPHPASAKTYFVAVLEWINLLEHTPDHEYTLECTLLTRL